LCQDSWLEWKERDPARLQRYVDAIHTNFSRDGNNAWVTPKSPQTVAGLPVLQVYPESVGMGVGFSVLVGTTLDRAKKIIEQKLGRSFGKCEPPSDNIRGCDMKIGDRKTIGVISEDNDKATKVLVGCFYFYAK